MSKTPHRARSMTYRGSTLYSTLTLRTTKRSKAMIRMERLSGTGEASLPASSSVPCTRVRRLPFSRQVKLTEPCHRVTNYPVLRWWLTELYNGITEGTIHCCVAARGEYAGHCGHCTVYRLHAGPIRKTLHRHTGSGSHLRRHHRPWHSSYIRSRSDRYGAFRGWCWHR